MNLINIQFTSAAKQMRLTLKKNPKTKQCLEDNNHLNLGRECIPLFVWGKILGPDNTLE